MPRSVPPKRAGFDQDKPAAVPPIVMLSPADPGVRAVRSTSPLTGLVAVLKPSADRLPLITLNSCAAAVVSVGAPEAASAKVPDPELKELLPLEPFVTEHDDAPGAVQDEPQ